MFCGSLDGRGVEAEYIHVCVCLSPFSVHLKLSGRCYLAISQYKIRSLKLKKKELELSNHK